MSYLRKFSVENMDIDEDYLRKIKHPLVEGYRYDPPIEEKPPKVTNDEKTNTCCCWPTWLRSSQV